MCSRCCGRLAGSTERAVLTPFRSVPVLSPAWPSTRSFSSQDLPQRQPRHFVAIVPPTEVLDAIELLQKKLATQLPNGSAARWVPRENLHVTLRFLGAALAAKNSEAKAIEVMRDVAASTEPFDLELRSLGVFPHWNKPRVLWLGLPEISTALNRLRERLWKAWLDAKVVSADAREPDEGASNHLTVARWNDVYVKKIQGDMMREALRTHEPTHAVGRWTVKEILLLDSTLGNGQPVYMPTAIAALNAEPEPLRRRSRVRGAV